LKQVVVLEDAAEDIEAARDFYEVQQSGIGEYCVDSLLADIESLGRLSGIHPIHFDFHRMLATRFPFGIYYREQGDKTQVFAVLDLRRNPNWVRKELKQRGT
jgi:plasmid stabilization system protein ParE